MIDLTAASIDFSLVGPEIALIAAAALALLVGCKKQWEGIVPAIGIIGLVVSLVIRQQPGHIVDLILNRTRLNLAVDSAIFAGILLRADDFYTIWVTILEFGLPRPKRSAVQQNEKGGPDR